jgi:PTS system nitrogen regulatory IIA component
LPTALGASLLAFGRTSSGIPFGGPRRSLTDLFFLVLCQDARTHLAVLARLGRLLRVEGFVDQLRECPDSLSAHELLIATDRQVEA